MARLRVIDPQGHRGESESGRPPLVPPDFVLRARFIARASRVVGRLIAILVFSSIPARPPVALDGDAEAVAGGLPVRVAPDAVSDFGMAFRPRLRRGDRQQQLQHGALWCRWTFGWSLLEMVRGYRGFIHPSAQESVAAALSAKRDGHDAGLNMLFNPQTIILRPSHLRQEFLRIRAIRE